MPASGCFVDDLDNDGYLDIVLSNNRAGVGTYIYWGGKNGYSIDERTELPTSMPGAIRLRTSIMTDTGPCNLFQQEKRFISDKFKHFWG